MNPETTSHSLKDTSFNTELNKTVIEIVHQYVEIVKEYYAFIGENKNIIHKPKYPFLLARGLDTVSHVFFMILLYTKNIDLTSYHSQKSFYLYVEFIEQIIDVQNTFLHLSSRDACTFVYKKTIYEMNAECRKYEHDEKTDAQFQLIHTYIQIYKEIPCDRLDEFHTVMIQYNLSQSQLNQIYDYVNTSDCDYNIAEFIK
jgi:hypothetical protein